MEKSLIFCLSVLMLIGCQSDQQHWWTEAMEGGPEIRKKYAEKISRNHRFYQGSDWSQKMYDTLIMLQPDVEMYYRQKSVPYTKRGDFHVAIPLLEKSLELDPQENLYYYSWLTLFHYRDYEKALKLLHRYDDLTPNVRDYAQGTNVNYLKGLALAQLGRFDEAIEEYNQVISDEGEQAGTDVYTYKGIAHYKNNEPQLAIESLEKAMQFFEKNGMAMYFLALSKYDIGEISAASNWLIRAGENILKGNKKNHPYYEVFDEVHYEQVLDKAEEWGIDHDLVPLKSSD